jgi:hypothetical protein
MFSVFFSQNTNMSRTTVTYKRGRNGDEELALEHFVGEKDSLCLRQIWKGNRLEEKYMTNSKRTKTSMPSPANGAWVRVVPADQKQLLRSPVEYAREWPVDDETSGMCDRLKTGPRLGHLCGRVVKVVNDHEACPERQ